MTNYFKPLPQIDDINKPYWDALKQHQITLQRCSKCKELIFYPRLRCHYCMGEQLQWQTISGNATLYSYTVAHRISHPGFVDDLPLVVAIVTLDEGVNLATNLVNVNDNEIVIGMSLQPVFQDLTDDITLLFFEPADHA